MFYFNNYSLYLLSFGFCLFFGFVFFHCVRKNWKYQDVTRNRISKKENKDKQWSTNRYTTKDRETRMEQKNRGKDREVLMTSETYPLSFVTQICRLWYHFNFHGSNKPLLRRYCWSNYWLAGLDPSHRWKCLLSLIHL